MNERYCWKYQTFLSIYKNRILNDHYYTPKNEVWGGGVYRSHLVVGWLVGRSVQTSIAWLEFNITTYNGQAHWEEVQCTRTTTLFWLNTGLLPFVTLPCPGHNLKTTVWNSKQLHTIVKHNKGKCSAQEL